VHELVINSESNKHARRKNKDFILVYFGDELPHPRHSFMAKHTKSTLFKVSLCLSNLIIT